MSQYGIWMVWDEHKPVFPGTDQHDPNVGKWYPAGAAWCHMSHVPILFECVWAAGVAANVEWENRRNAHPPFVLVAARIYAPTSPGMMMGCGGPDLSGLGGWLP